jgi:hypothetical protein
MKERRERDKTKTEHKNDNLFLSTKRYLSLTFISQLHLNVAAIKATGTGGLTDSSLHRRAGALVAFDQVDSGLPTTYVDASLFEKRILHSFYLAQLSNAEVILVEMGGDICWANNETLLCMSAITQGLKKGYEFTGLIYFFFSLLSLLSLSSSFFLLPSSFFLLLPSSSFFFLLLPSSSFFFLLLPSS